jgi:hypothetical protein
MPTEALHYNGVNAEMEDGFHNDTDPTFHRKRELPVHRLMIFMSANGWTNREIAEKVGQTEHNVSQVLRQPWARQRIVAIQREAGEGESAQLFRNGATAAYERIMKIAEHAVLESERLKANMYLVNRFYGQPTQPIEQVGKKPEELTTDELQAQLAGLLGENASAEACLKSNIENVDVVSAKN